MTTAAVRPTPIQRYAIGVAPGGKGVIATYTTATDGMFVLADDVSQLERDRAELIEALEYALWQHNGGGTPMHNHWAAKAQNTLARLKP